MFSSSSSPSHLLSLAPPTMSMGTIGLAGSKLSASENPQCHTVSNQSTTHSSRASPLSFIVSWDKKKKNCKNNKGTASPTTAAERQNRWRIRSSRDIGVVTLTPLHDHVRSSKGFPVVCVADLRRVIRLSERVDADCGRRRERIVLRCVFSRCPVVPILRIKHNKREEICW